MGFDTIAFSTSAAKENEAREFGATEFYLTSEPEKISKPLDVLIVAGNGYPNWEKYVDFIVTASSVIIALWLIKHRFLKNSVLGRLATIVLLTAPGRNIELS